MLSPYYSRFLVSSSIALLSFGTLLGQIQSANAINITFDYSLDTNNFFGNSTRKARLEEAASYFEGFGDTLDAITPSGSNTWDATFKHPGTGAENHTISDLSIGANEILVFAGGRNLSGSTLGQGGPGGFGASGNSAWLNTVKARGETSALAANPTDFGPWGGVITFDTNSTWHFGDANDNPSTGENDFLSVAIHELGHLLGFGTADSWDNLVSGSQFTGSSSSNVFGSNVPLDSGLGHWENGTTSIRINTQTTMPNLDGLSQETAMDPSILVGSRKFLTELDYAGLEDIGWEVNTANVPFEFSPSLGIFFVAGMFGTKKFWNTWKSKQ